MELRQEELESLLNDEERALLESPELPEETKAEIAERLDRFEETDIEAKRIEGEPL